MDLIKIVRAVTPAFQTIRQDIASLKLKHPGKSPDALSDIFVRNIRNKYTSVGVISAIPGIFPGIGTAAQVAIEAGTVSADVALMLRWMATVFYGTGLIYGRDTEENFDAEFTTVLGIWSGVLVPGKAAADVGATITIGHFDKFISDKVRNRMNQKIGRKLVTKYGSKRGGVFMGRLVPFGIGAVVGGTFNYFTMQRFGKAADDYFSAEGQEYTIVE